MKGPIPVVSDNMAMQGYSGPAVMLDAKEQSVSYAECPGFDFTERRITSIRLNEPMRLRVVNRLEHVEVYVNDELRLVAMHYLNIGGEVGLFIDRAEAHFKDIRLRTLNVTRPA